MKKLITILTIAIIAASCSNGANNARKVDTVYVSKPKINDSTILKAHLEVRMWAAIFQTLVNQANKIERTKLDTSDARKVKDSIFMSVNTLSKAINDSTVNKPYF